VKRFPGCAAVCLLVVALASPAAAQFPILQQPGQPALPDPQELQVTRRAPLTITPSFTISEEFNDNIFLDNDNRVSDFITGFTPGIAINYERPTYRLSTGYNFTAEIFAKETDESHAFDRQNFWLDTSWRVTPQVTVTLTDTFIFSTDTNLIARESVATGRDRSWSNALGAGASWQIDPLWTLRGGGSYTVERFSSDRLRESDVYHVNVGADRRLSPRLTVGVGYDFGYFDIASEPESVTHTPRVGASWRATETITLALSGGPSIEQRDGDTRVTPAITASYAQRVGFGSIGLSYDRAIGTASGLGGTTDNDLISGYVTVTTLLRGLTVQFLPRYSIVKSPHSDEIDVRSFTAALQVTYRLTDWMTLIGGYQFFHQRSDSTALSSIGTPIANDADQNRLFVGVTFGYPIRFD
jgi:hypothetical protein